jgi:hypothetical protein
VFRPPTGSKPFVAIEPGNIRSVSTINGGSASSGPGQTRFERLVREETPVTPDTALRLARYFGTTPEFWLGIQTRFDLEKISRSLAAEIDAIRPREAV